MKMRSGRTSCIARLPYALASFDAHALNYADGFHVGVSGLVSEAVVYDYGVAISEEFEAYAFHNPVTCGIDRIARFHGEIHTGV